MGAPRASSPARQRSVDSDGRWHARPRGRPFPSRAPRAAPHRARCQGPHADRDGERIHLACHNSTRDAPSRTRGRPSRMASATRKQHVIDIARGSILETVRQQGRAGLHQGCSPEPDAGVHVAVARMRGAASRPARARSPGSPARRRTRRGRPVRRSARAACCYGRPVPRHRCVAAPRCRARNNARRADARWSPERGSCVRPLPRRSALGQSDPLPRRSTTPKRRRCVRSDRVPRAPRRTSVAPGLYAGAA
jgi:hypothetical protein